MNNNRPAYFDGSESGTLCYQSVTTPSNDTRPTTLLAVVHILQQLETS
jgi:hypothetical protein